MWFALRHDENEGPLSTHAQQNRENTRRDIEAVGGTFELPSPRNINGYHENPQPSRGTKVVESSDESSPPETNGASSPVGRPSHEERTYAGT